MNRFAPSRSTVIAAALLLSLSQRAHAQTPTVEPRAQAAPSDVPPGVPYGGNISPGDPQHAFVPATGKNYVWDRDKQKWIDAQDGSTYLLPGTKGVPDAPSGVPYGGNISPGDPQHAFVPATGKNYVWDRDKQKWIDAQDGSTYLLPGTGGKGKETSSPGGKPTGPPTKVATGCTDIGMTTPRPGQDAASQLTGARIIPAGTSPGFAVDIKTPPGLNTIIFTTQRSNRVEVYLPNGLFAGKTFSASIKAEIKNPGDQNELNGYSLRIGGRQTALSNGVFSVALPNAAADSTTELVLVDKKGKQKAGVSLPVNPALPSLPQEFDLPSSGTSGDLIVVQGPIEGAIEPTDYIKVGGKNIQLLAKSENQLVALNTSDVAGLTEIESNTNGRVAKSPFRNLTLKLWADKYHLLKGEGTIVHILVGGLERLEAPAKMTIETTGAVNMAGGNSQALSITPSEVQPDGTYSTDRALSSYEAGDFGVTVTVKVSPNCGFPERP